MGTLQNGSEHVFQSIAEACSALDAQLVLSMGGNREPSELGSLPESSRSALCTAA
jgi:hypothetical protein